MKKKSLILVFLFILPKIVGQIIYDTIPTDTMKIGLGVIEEMVVFLNIDNEFYKTFKGIEYPDKEESKGGIVVISTVFGHDGKIKNTRVTRSLDHYHDSICFQAVKSLSNWIPAVTRGNFVNMPFTFPFKFDQNGILEFRSFSEVFNTDLDQYTKKQKDFNRKNNI